MKSLLIFAALLAMFLLVWLGYFFTPAVYAVQTAKGVTVHFETLGEYPSSLYRIEVLEQGSGRMVWRVTTRGELFQLQQFELVPGLNSGTLQPTWGSVQTEIPVQGPFRLQSGISYRTSVCFKGWPYICRGADFVLGSG